MGFQLPVPQVASPPKQTTGSPSHRIPARADPTGTTAISGTGFPIKTTAFHCGLVEMIGEETTAPSGEKDSKQGSVRGVEVLTSRHPTGGSLEKLKKKQAFLTQYPAKNERLEMGDF